MTNSSWHTSVGDSVDDLYGPRYAIFGMEDSAQSLCPCAHLAVGQGCVDGRREALL
jgi:hypothetical protein